jgi:hypothetical protein
MQNRSQKQVCWMAIIIGIFLPMAETVRRYHQLSDPGKFLHWFDDYILGGILIAAAWMVIKQKANAISYLIGAWGIGTGALFLSFLGQIDYIRTDSTDMGGVFSTYFVLVIKGLILVFMIFGMMKSINAANSQR